MSRFMRLHKLTWKLPEASDPDRTASSAFGDTRSSWRRAGIGPRRVARDRTRRVLLMPRIWVPGLLAIVLIPMFIAGMNTALKAWFDSSISPLLTGFLLGAALVSVPWTLWTLTLSIDGSANWRIGAEAEQWTARELHRLGASWHIQHGVPFPENGYPRDVDHVAIGSYGVLAVETKWTSGSVDLRTNRLPKVVQDAVRQAERNAGRVQALLSRVADINVIPLVVFWGRDVTAPAEPVRREGRVRIVAGSQAPLWRPLLAASRLDAQTVTRLSAKVDDWLVKQEERSVGVFVQRYLRQAKRLGRASMTATAILISLFLVSKVSTASDRFFGVVFGMGGGAIGAIIFLLPLVLALATPIVVYLGRRLDPRIAGARGMGPLAFWCAAFGALALVSP